MLQWSTRVTKRYILKFLEVDGVDITDKIRKGTHSRFLYDRRSWTLNEAVTDEIIADTVGKVAAAVDAHQYSHDRGRNGRFNSKNDTGNDRQLVCGR
jgi:hypothetical protein